MSDIVWLSIIFALVPPAALGVLVSAIIWSAWRAEKAERR